MNRAQLERENARLLSEVSRASTDYFRALHLLVPYMEAELEHLRRENAELKTQTERDEHG